jgi:outer membrane protein OmpA-like peptidoglycan-associated protein
MAADSSHSGLSSSMTDLMTSLAVIFILLLVATLNNKQQEVRQSRENILAKLRETLNEELVEYKGLELKDDKEDPLSLIVVVPEGLLNFPVNKSEIPGQGLLFLQRITPKLAETVCSEEFRPEVSSIVVEGHADRSGGDDINLPLSQQRSMSVVHETLGILAKTDNQRDATAQTTRPCFLDLVSATGRGSVDPYVNDDGTEDLAKSRRVVFKIRVKSHDEKVINKAIPAPEKK